MLRKHLSKAVLRESIHKHPKKRSAMTTCGAARLRPEKELTEMDWRHDAACRDEDPELFFPVGNSGPALLQIAEAKAVCHRCPAASECLAWALASGQDSGVWGGMSEDERRALKRRRAHIGMRTA